MAPSPETPQPTQKQTQRLLSGLSPTVWPEKAQLDKLAAPLTTYRIGGPIDEFYSPQSVDELVTLLEKVPQGAPLTLLGWGGNTLVASQGIGGVTIWTRKCDGVEQLSDNTFRIEAGAHLAKVAKIAADAGCTGGECFIGIPGTIGGAIRMNAGALGQQTSDVVTAVRVWNRQQCRLETWPVEDLQFAYRHSAINPTHHIVVDAVLTFTPAEDIQVVRQRMRDSVDFRKTHHPIEPNGGSVFRNPLPTAECPSPWPVGRMLDSLGARGNGDEGQASWRVGGAAVSPCHANFIINQSGQATSSDVLTLMLRMKDAVRQAFGLNIVPENLFIGDATPEEKALWQQLTQ